MSAHSEPTELADMIRQVAAGRPVSSLVPPSLGWWQTDSFADVCEEAYLALAVLENYPS